MKLKKSIAVLFMLFAAVFSIAASADDIYSVVPAFSPYYAGIVKSEILNKTLEELNYIRRLIGVPDNVKLNSDYTNKAQHGAVLLDAVGTLTYTPSKPSDMTQEFYDLGYAGAHHGDITHDYSSNMTLSYSLKLFIDDSDEEDIPDVGQRRWLMNPRLKNTGFGISTRKGCAVVYVVEEFKDFHNVDNPMTQEQHAEYLEWLKWPNSDEFITWPSSQNEHPLTYFNSKTAWSVTLNSDIFNGCTASAVNVKLTRLSDNRTWNFSSTKSDGDFYINDEYAYDECIIFRPNEITAYNNGEQWKVEISGLTRKDGKAGNISYNVKFTSALTGYEENKNSSSGSGGGCNTGLGAGVFLLLIILEIPRVKNNLRVGNK